MAKGKASGFHLKNTDVPTVMGMINRGDRHHDIAAWFGVNQGRIKDAQDGKYGVGMPLAASKLPPKGAPGVKGRRLRENVGFVQRMLSSQSSREEILEALENAIAEYDAHEA